MSSPCHGAHGAGTKYTYAELQGLWITNGGSKKTAPMAAAIALAESGGCSSAGNPSGASGLWQILGNPFPGNVWNPATNARMAVSKYHSQGWHAWTTYTSGAYKAHLHGRTSPDLNVPSSVQTVAQIEPYARETCVFAFPGISIPLIGNAGQFCILPKHTARALAGGTLLAVGGIFLGLPAIALVAAAAGMKALGAGGPVLEQAGGAMALIPGLEGVGVGVAAAGRASKASAAQTKARRASRENQRAAGAGTLIEEVPEGEGEQATRDLAARTQRRQQAASRSRARRETSRQRSARTARPGVPAASREEAGF